MIDFFRECNLLDINYRVEYGNDGIAYINDGNSRVGYGVVDLRIAIHNYDIYAVCMESTGLYTIVRHKDGFRFPYKCVTVILTQESFVVNAVTDNGDTCWLKITNDLRGGKKIGRYKLWENEYREFTGAGILENLSTESLIVQISDYKFATLNLSSLKIGADKESATFIVKRNRVIDSCVDFDRYAVQLNTDANKKVIGIAFKHPITGNVLKSTFNFIDADFYATQLLGYLTGHYDAENNKLTASKRDVDAFLDVQVLFNRTVSLRGLFMLREYVLAKGNYNSDYEIWVAMKDALSNLLRPDGLGNEWGVIVQFQSILMLYKREGGAGVELVPCELSECTSNMNYMSLIEKAVEQYTSRMFSMPIIECSIIDQYDDVEHDRILKNFPEPNIYTEARHGKLSRYIFEDVSFYRLTGRVDTYEYDKVVHFIIAIGHNFSYKLTNYPAKSGYTKTNIDSIIVLTT